jgi:hypothetical protein
MNTEVVNILVLSTTISELVTRTKLFKLDRCSQKNADFTVMDPAKFIDQKFYETTNAVKNDDSVLIRSVASCRLD